MKIDSLSYKISIFSLFLAVPLFIILALLTTGHRIQETWQSFAVVCAKTWDLVIGYIFYFNNFWALFIIGLFSFALIKSFIYLFNQLYKSYSLKNSFGKYIISKDNHIRVVEDSRSFAVTVGFLKPQIYLSSSLAEKLTKQELEAVIYHEKYHQENFHPFFLLAISFLSSLLFFLPVFKSVKSFFYLKYEVLADEFSIGKTSKKTLSLALYKVINHSKYFDLPETVSAFSVTKDRVNVLANNSKPTLEISKSLSLVSILMSLLISLSLLSSSEVNASTRDDVFVYNVGQCYSPSESIISLMTFGRQSEVNMTYDLTD